MEERMSTLHRTKSTFDSPYQRQEEEEESDEEESDEEESDEEEVSEEETDEEEEEEENANDEARRAIALVKRPKLLTYEELAERKRNKFLQRNLLVQQQQMMQRHQLTYSPKELLESMDMEKAKLSDEARAFLSMKPLTMNERKNKQVSFRARESLRERDCFCVDLISFDLFCLIQITLFTVYSSSSAHAYLR